MNLKPYLTFIKRLPVKIVRNVKKIINRNKKTLFLSFGENCLPDNILARHSVKSFSTPYASGRSNIEYILQIEKDGFQDFLNPEFMQYHDLGKKKVVRLSKYDRIENTYYPLHSSGFEFTHHDVLQNKRARHTIAKRAKRMLGLKNKQVNIFYHSRYNEHTDETLLLRHLAELKKIYEARCQAVNVFMFTQRIVSDIKERKVEHEIKNGIHIYKFHTLHIGEGDN